MKDVEVDDVSWKQPQYAIDPIKLIIGCSVQEEMASLVLGRIEAMEIVR